MATIGVITNLAVGVSASTSAFVKGIGGVNKLLAQLGFNAKKNEKQLTAMGVAAGTMVGHLGAEVLSRAASGIASVFTTGVKGATDLAETTSKVQTVLGDSADAVIKQADSMARAFGLPKQEILDASANIALIGKASGQTQAESAGLANTMTKLAADAASFYNVPMADALEKIRSGLIGEAEPIRSFGVLLSEAAVEQEALTMKLIRNKAELTDQIKVQARASLITKGMVDASGDLERTAGSTANQWRKLTGTFTNTAVAIGESLSPAIGALVTGLGESMSWIAEAVERNKDVFTSWSTWVADCIKAIPSAWDTFVASLAVVLIKSQEFGANVSAVVQTIAKNGTAEWEWLTKNWVRLIQDAVKAQLQILHNLGENIGTLAYSIWQYLQDPTQGFHVDFKPLLEGFEATVDKFPEIAKPAFVSMQNEIDAIGEDLARKWEARDKANKTKAVKDEVAKKQELPKPAVKLGKEKKHETAGALLLGSSEARSAVVKQRQGASDVRMKQLEEAKKQTKELQKIAKKVAGPAKEQVVDLTK